MTRAQVAMAVGAAAGPAVVLLVRALAPAPPSLASVRRRVSGDPLGRVPAPAPAAAAARQRMRRRRGLVGAASESLARSELGTWFAARFAPELRAAQLTVPQVLAQMLAAGIAGFVLVAGLAGALVAAGVGVEPLPMVGLAVFGAGVAMMIVLEVLRDRAGRARRAFSHAVGQYVMLCSSVMAGGRSAEWSARYAAALGDGPAFTAIAAALSSSPAMGRTTWEALETVGREYGTGELVDLAATVERATNLGADASEAAAVIAQAMRNRSLDELERAADRSNIKMLGPTYLFVLGFVALLAFPLIAQLSGRL